MEKEKWILAPRLKKGDEIRVIAPAESFSRKFSDKMKQKTVEGLEKLGLRVSFGKYVHEQGSFKSATVEQRLEDLHSAFQDDSVKAVIAANGGSSANQLLKYIDYDLIQKKPKIFCGLSDITEIISAVYTKTGLVTYYGPHFTMLGASQYLDPMLDNMKNTFFSEDPVRLRAPDFYSNSEWDKEKILNDGFWTINEGETEGQCIGGNLLTLNFLLGYEYVPDIKNRILFLEENKIIDYRGILKEIQQILNHPQGEKIKGVMIGRFQRQSRMSRDLLHEMVASKKEFLNIPVVGNIDCGHTVPLWTFPFGGSVRITAKADDQVSITLLQH